MDKLQKVITKTEVMRRYRTTGSDTGLLGRLLVFFPMFFTQNLRAKTCIW